MCESAWDASVSMLDEKEKKKATALATAGGGDGGD